jgi:hypothetical protein
MRLLLCFLLWFAAACMARAQDPAPTAFTYQGRLREGSGAVNGKYDLRFGLFNVAEGGSALRPALTNAAVSAVDGCFSVTLDFGAGVFDGGPRWLEIAVRTNGGAAFGTLAPRQPVTWTPYAMNAGFAASLAGAYSNAVALLNPGNAFAGGFSGNAAGLTNVPAAALTGALPLASLPPLADGATNDLSSVVRGGPRLFLSALYYSNAPVTFLSFGDSMSAPTRSIQTFICAALQNRLGTAGYSLDNFDNTTLPVWTNGAVRLNPPTAYWFAQHYSMPPGGSLWWYSANDARGVFCTHLGVYWVARPEGGVFTLSTSTEGGAWTSRLTLDGYAPSPQGRFTNYNAGFGWHRVRVDGVSGTNIILGPYVQDNNSTGLHVSWLDCGGIMMRDFTNIPSAIRDPVFRGIQPNLMFWHMKEEFVEPSLDALEATLATNAPQCDVVYVGTPYAYWDNEYPSTRNFNRALRGYALRKSRLFVDCMTLCVSYDWLLANKLMDDTVHPSNRANEWLATRVWNELGLDAVAMFSRYRSPGPLAITARGVGTYAFSVSSMLSGADARAFFGLRNSYNTMGVFLENTTDFNRAALLGGVGLPTELNGPTTAFGPVFSQGRVRRGGFTGNGTLDLSVGLQTRTLTVTNDAIGAAALWLFTNNTPSLNAPNGSLCTTTDGRFFVRSNGVWVLK